MRRPGRLTASVAALALVVVVGLGVLMRGPASGSPGDGPAAQPASAAAEPDGQPTLERETTAAASPRETGPSRSLWLPDDGSLPLSEPDPDAPVGPQPIPADDVVPVRVRIPAIDVDSVLEDLARDEAGVLQPPVVPEQAGWFTGGTVPGDRGPAVIAGHVDSGVAGAVFRDLDDLRPGAEVFVEMSDGEVLTFLVDRAEVFGQAQAQFPTAEVYGPVPDRQLRLITCHNFDPDNRRYVDNLVVYATALDS